VSLEFMQRRFKIFLESLKREDNTNILEAILEGYNVLTEASIGPVYHGTGKEFIEFEPHIRKNMQMGFGIHFTPDPKFAELYKTGKQGRVIKAKLNINKLFDAEKIYNKSSEGGQMLFEMNPKFMWMNNVDTTDKAAYGHRVIDSVTPQRAEKILRKHGYDGIRYIADMKDAGSHSIYTQAMTKAKAETYVVFDNSQIQQIGTLTESGNIAEIKKTQTFKTDEGKFSVYDTIKFPRGRNNMFTVKEDKDGWIVRNVILPDELKRKGIATSIYRKLNNESIKKTGNPLRSTQPRKLIGGEIVHELSPDGIALWDSFVRKGYAKKLGEKNYVFTSNLMEAIGPVYHGTNQEFENFDLDKATQGVAWFTDKKETIESGESGAQGTKYIMERYLDIPEDKLANWDQYDKYSLGELVNMGYRGVKLPSGDENTYIVFDTKDIVTKPLMESREGSKKLSEYPRYQYSNKVTIFRATPSDSFFTDDYITLSGKFAVEHAENNHAVNDEQNNVIKAVVHPDLVTDAYNPGEYFYKGEPIKGEIIYVSKGDEYEGDIPKFEASDSSNDTKTRDLILTPNDTLFHGTVEDFDVKDVRVGGYDSIFWTVNNSNIAQSYIPVSGITAFTNSELLRKPDSEFAKQLGIEFSDVKKEGNQVRSYRMKNDYFIKVSTKKHELLTNLVNLDKEYKEAEKDYDKAEKDYDKKREILNDITNKIISAQEEYQKFNENKLLNEYVNKKMKSFGYEPKDINSYDSNAEYRIKIKSDHTILPADFKESGRLFVIKPKRNMKIYDYAMGTDPDLTDLDYHKHDVFEKVQEFGYDGIKINDFAQTEEFGNVGHKSIGFFKDAIKDLNIKVVENVSHPKFKDRIGEKSEEYSNWKKQNINEGVFLNFLESFKNKKTNNLIESILKGYQIIYEVIGPVYHGTGSDIKEFKYEFTNQGADQLGSGFYFTDSPQEASAYSTTRKSSDQPKPGGEDNPTVITAKLNINNPLDADAVGNITYKQVRSIILMSPQLDDGLSNWGDVEYSGRESVLRDAVEGYVIENENILRGLFSLANDFYRDNIEQFNKVIRTVLGYDGVVKHWDDRTHYVAWFPEQIKIIGNPLNESVNEYEKLEKNKVPLTDDERKEVFKKDAVWSYGSSIDPNTGKKVKKVSAVWKSKDKKGNVTYITNTHRAYNTAKSLKAIINKYHNFIKGTS